MNNNRKNKNIDKNIDKSIVNDTNPKTYDEMEFFEKTINLEFLEIMNEMKCIQNQVASLKLKVDGLQKILAENKI